VEYTLLPLKQAELFVPMGMGMMMGDMTQWVNAPVYVWYMKGAKRKIVVDG